MKQEDLVDMNFIRFPTAERRLIQTTGLRKKVTVNAGFSRAVEATSAEVRDERVARDREVRLGREGREGRIGRGTKR